MLTLNIIGLVAVLAMVIYIVCFLCRYRVIPQSLSVTAEWSGRYHWWQTTICTVMGFLCYWLATSYPYHDYIVGQVYRLITLQGQAAQFHLTEHGYGLLTMLGCAGSCGLALAGYYSYTPLQESKRTLTIHKVGSFSGAVALVLFYIIKDVMYSGQSISWIFCAVALVVALVLGLTIKGKRLVDQTEVRDFGEVKVMEDGDGSYKRYTEESSVVFWMEIAIIVIVSSDIINKLINSI